MKYSHSRQSTVSTFQETLQAFEEAKFERSKTWPAVFAEFDVAFRASREDRALSTPRLNILDVFGLKTRELCHSRAIAWFLSETATHEQGSLFLNRLLRVCGLSDASYEGYTVQREKSDKVNGRAIFIDVIVYKPDGFAVFIENKVEHHEREYQFEDLQTSLVKFSTTQNNTPASRRIAVFLTDHGGSPRTAHKKLPAGLLAPNVRPIKRLTLFQEFREALADPNVKKSSLLINFLDAYIEAIPAHSSTEL
jgi:hypothetical protein